MKNAYIIDLFLTGMLMIMLFYIYVDVLIRVKQIRQVIDSNTLSIAIGQVLKQSIIMSIPLIGLLCFLVWRFYAAMVAAQVWGIGGAGLIVIVMILGIGLIWLDMLLVCIKNSRFIDASLLANKAKRAKRKTMPKPNTPLSEVSVR